MASEHVTSYINGNDTSTCKRYNFSPLIADMQLERFDECLYQKCGFNKPLREIFQLMKTLKIREDDVIGTGFPRSGTHWTFELMHMILHQTTELQKEHFWHNLLENKVCKLEQLENDPSPRYMGTHFRTNRLPAEVVQKKIKIIYPIRNPKDVMVSMYKLWSSLKGNEGGFRGTWNQFFEMVLANEFTHGTWFDNVLDMERFMMENPDVPVHVHVYEDMVQRPVENVKKLCHFLQVPDILAKKIALITRFDKMSNSKKYKEIETQVCDSQNGESAILGKGVIGNWEKTFTVAQNRTFDNMFKLKMANSKLARLIEKYIM